jgi:hypothetical protein
MNLISFIKRILKIGGPQIDLVTRDSKYYPSDWIRGELFITAAEYRQNISSITINLKDFWVESVGSASRIMRTSRYHQHDSVIIANDFVFLPRMKYQFPFEIQLPTNCRESSEDSGWRLGVVINAVESSVSRVDFDINVQLSKELQKIIEAVEKDTNFMEVRKGRKYIPDSSATRFVFRPPEHLQSEIQYLMLDVSMNEEGGIKGNLLFKLNESRSFSLIKTNTPDNYSHEFQIKAAESFDSNVRIDSRAITNIISEKLLEDLGSKYHS